MLFRSSFIEVQYLTFFNIKQADEELKTVTKNSLLVGGWSLLNIYKIRPQKILRLNLKWLTAPYIVHYVSYEMLALYVLCGIVHTWLNPKWFFVRHTVPCLGAVAIIIRPT